jgi:hypothetical protein
LPAHRLDSYFARSNPDANENLLSSATLFTWEGVKLVLGADVVYPYWREICDHFQAEALNQHAALKVAHHASENGVFHGLLTGTGLRFWIATPYNSSHIPNFADSHGPDVLLQHQDAFYLTGLPTAHSAQGPWPCEATRSELRAGTVPRLLDFTISKGLSGWTLPKPNLTEPTCYAMISADTEGSWRIDALGAGSVRVRR